MPQSDLHAELRNTEREPLLPIEKKLIVGSLVTGVVLLAVLALINQLFPLAH